MRRHTAGVRLLPHRPCRPAGAQWRMKTSIIRLPELFRRWRKADWPRSTGPHEPLRGEEVRNAEHSAASQEWEDEGGAVNPAPYAGPKLPL